MKELKQNSSGEKLYIDSTGVKCNIRGMIRREPEWVVSRFEVMEAELTRLREEQALAKRCIEINSYLSEQVADHAKTIERLKKALEESNQCLIKGGMVQDRNEREIERLRGFLSEFYKRRYPIVDFYWNESERASKVYVFEDGSTTKYTKEIADADCGHSRLQIALGQCKDLPKPPKTQAPDNP